MENNKSQIIKDIIKEQNQEALFLEPSFDIALIGTSNKYGKLIVAAYNIDACLDILIKQGYDEIEAYNKFHDSLNSAIEEEHHPVFINDFRKINVADIDKQLEKILGANNPF